MPAPTTASQPSPTNSQSSKRPSPDELEALQNRDPDAIKRFIYSQRQLIMGVLMRYVKDSEEAQDLLQETFFQAIRSLPSYRGQSKVSTWLYSIAKNVALQRLRKSNRYSHHDGDQLSRMAARSNGRGTKADVSEPSAPDTETVRSEEDHLLHEALEELPESYQQIIALRDLQELSTREVADKLDLTRVNVRVRLHRARKRLRKVLAPHVEEHYQWAA